MKHEGVSMKVWDIGMYHLNDTLCIWELLIQTLHSIGGQERFRDTWDQYAQTCNCIIFVVDMADVSFV